MAIYELLAIAIYLGALTWVGIHSYKRHLTETDFIIGARSLGPWLTAMAAQASDMTAWMFMAYPALFLIKGLNQVWVAIGLILFMFLNWHFIAPKIRVATEKFNSLTFSSFFESRVGDKSGAIRVFTALIALFFYTTYVSSGVVGMGLLIETLFQIPYDLSIIIGLLIIVPYVFMGGYLTLAWIDLFQGLFLMAMILFVPLYLLPHAGGLSGIMSSLQAQHLSTSLLPSSGHFYEIFLLMASLGLGYFGQPHIVTKFMGIKNVAEIPKSKYIGISWMVLSLGGATLVGLVGAGFFQGTLANPELVYISMVKESFHPFLIGFIFCAVLATTINSSGSFILILTSTLSEDLYKKLIRRKASSSELLMVSRICVVIVGVAAYLIAKANLSSIYTLVIYAWSGLGASFGPLMIFSLYSKRLNRFGAWAGILTGGTIAASWPLINPHLPLNIPPIVPGFLLSSLAIFVVSHLTNKGVYAQKT